MSRQGFWRAPLEDVFETGEMAQGHVPLDIKATFFRSPNKPLILLKAPAFSLHSQAA